MINWQELTIDMFVQQLRTVYQRTYGDINSDYGRIVTWCGRLVRLGRALFQHFTRGLVVLFPVGN